MGLLRTPRGRTDGVKLNETQIRPGSLPGAEPCPSETDVPTPAARRVRIILVDPAMSMPSTYESLLDAARRAALTGGLAEIRRMHFLLGPDSDVTGQHFVTDLRTRFRGPLLERCAVTWEPASRGGVVLASIEGYVTE